MHTARYPEVPDDFGHWLAGFIDGEGCFSIRHCRSTDTFGCRLVISLRDDDTAILEEIRTTTACGRVTRRARYRGRRDFDTKPGAMWIVATRADCVRIAEIFDKYRLRAKKARDYTIWRAALAVWLTVDQGGHGGKNAGHWRRMLELKTILSEIRAYHESVILKVGVDDPIPACRDEALF